MKKFIPVLLVLCLLLVPMAGNVSADDHEQTSFAGEQSPAAPAAPADPAEHAPDREQPAENMPDSAPAEAETPAMEEEEAREELVDYTPGSVPADSAPLDAILLPVNALVLSMVEQGMTYDDGSDEFVWNVLYYMLSLYGQVDSRVELVEDTLILPAETAQDYLAALFSGRSDLPALPESLTDRVVYDPENDQFLLARGDFGLAESRLGPVERAADGTCLVGGTLTALDTEEVLCTFRAVLAENDTMFGFSILDLTIL